jgi:hypothetical protein
MKIEIPDEWIKRVLNAHPETPVEDALRSYLRMRDGSCDQIIIFAFGEYAFHEMAKQT